PAFSPDDFVAQDRHLDGDTYGDPAYVSNFREILKACKNNYPITIAYESERAGMRRSSRAYHPYKLVYSEYNDKFRLLCAAFHAPTQELKKVVLNLGRVISAGPSDLPYRVTREELDALFSEPNINPPIVVEISKERNALERFLLQFASFDRKTEYDPERDIYTCQISYDVSDETELLIRILSFGASVRVIGPPGFLKQVKERIGRQMELFAVTTNSE
ncbi:MAG: WYL domain-containing protein, partial [Firmicutes bacterium]|nr:WYL domain-containing protein [Bacillota bacterium]